MIEILKIKYKDGCELMHGRYDILAKLPDDCTNRDIIETMFPDAIKEMKVSYDWLNAPYRSENEYDKGR